MKIEVHKPSIGNRAWVTGSIKNAEKSFKVDDAFCIFKKYYAYYHVFSFHLTGDSYYGTVSNLKVLFHKDISHLKPNFQRSKAKIPSMCSCCCNSGSLIRLLKGKNEFALNCFTRFVEEVLLCIFYH